MYLLSVSCWLSLDIPVILKVPACLSRAKGNQGSDGPELHVGPCGSDSRSPWGRGDRKTSLSSPPPLLLLDVSSAQTYKGFMFSLKAGSLPSQAGACLYGTGKFPSRLGRGVNSSEILATLALAFS